jgi:hypothetical protein
MSDVEGETQPPAPPLVCQAARPGDPICGRPAITDPSDVPNARCRAHFYGDFRPLAKIEFALDEPDFAVRAAAQERVRTLLARAGVVIGDDIDSLGCTGLCEAFIRGAPGQGWSPEAIIVADEGIRDARFVRAHMDGSGHGLPCFVGPDRFCFIHEVVGALQPGQESRHPKMARIISRELTPEERNGVDLVDNARRVFDRDLNTRLFKTVQVLLDEARRGVPPPANDNANSNGQAAETTTGVVVPELGIVNDAPPPFTCSEHAKPFWRCRLCVAEALVKGDLEPQFLIIPTDDGAHANMDDIVEIAAGEIDGRVEEWNDQGVTAVGLFVKVAAWKRRLARSA